MEIRPTCLKKKRSLNLSVLERGDFRGCYVQNYCYRMCEQVLDGGIIIAATSILEEENGLGQGCFFRLRTFVLV